MEDTEKALADHEAKRDALERAKRAEILATFRAMRDSEIRTIYRSLGGSLAGLGVGSLGAMTAFLLGGARLDRDGQEIAGSTGVEDGAYQELLVKGAGYNRAAVATGLVGGMLVAAGGSLLVFAAVKYGRSSRKGARAAVHPTFGGVELRF